MSPAVLVFLPFALLLLMAKGTGTQSASPKHDKTSAGKVMGVLTEKGDFISFSSLADNSEVDTDNNGIVFEKNGKRYLLATVGEQD